MFFFKIAVFWVYALVPTFTPLDPCLGKVSRFQNVWQAITTSSSRFNFRPRRHALRFGNNQKSQGAESGLYAGPSFSKMPLLPSMCAAGRCLDGETTFLAILTSSDQYGELKFGLLGSHEQNRHVFYCFHLVAPHVGKLCLFHRRKWATSPSQLTLPADFFLRFSYFSNSL